MNLQQQQLGKSSWILTLLFEEGVHGIRVCRSYLASRPCIKLPDIDQTGRNSASTDVCMTSLLQFQHHLSPVTNQQPTPKDVFLIILHSLNAAVTTVDARTHAKLFCHVKIKLKSFSEKNWKLWSLLKEYWKYHLSSLTIESVPLQHKLNLGPD